MKKILILVSIINITLASCAWDNEEDLYGKIDCPPGGVSFSKTIQPLINTNCAVSGCHVGGQQFPPLQTYDQIYEVRNRVKAQTSDGVMPPESSGNSLTPNEIDLIACWVDAGAPEN